MRNLLHKLLTLVEYILLLVVAVGAPNLIAGIAAWLDGQMPTPGESVALAALQEFEATHEGVLVTFAGWFIWARGWFTPPVTVELQPAMGLQTSNEVTGHDIVLVNRTKRPVRINVESEIRNAGKVDEHDDFIGLRLSPNQRMPINFTARTDWYNTGTLTLVVSFTGWRRVFGRTEEFDLSALRQSRTALQLDMTGPLAHMKTMAKSLETIATNRDTLFIGTAEVASESALITINNNPHDFLERLAKAKGRCRIREALTENATASRTKRQDAWTHHDYTGKNGTRFWLEFGDEGPLAQTDRHAS